MTEKEEFKPDKEWKYSYRSIGALASSPVSAEG